MSRAVSTMLGVWVVAGAVFAAQPAADGATEDDGAAAVEAYLERFGLTEVLAERLRLRLETASDPERAALAERLGGMYAQLLGEATDDGTRRELERQSLALLDAVEGIDAFDLRINLARARYAAAERTAQRHQLRLATDEDVDTAQDVLEAVARELDALATKVAIEIRRLETRIDRGSERIAEDRERLAEQQRIRSLAAYFAGWSWTYLAELSGRKDAAREGLQAFSVLLGNGDEREPSIEQLPGGKLRLEPVARAALGTAHCLGVLGREGDGLAWLDLIDETPETSDSVRAGAFVLRVSLAVAAGTWSQLDELVNRERNNDRRGIIVGEAPTPLSTGRAHLIAVEVMEAIEGTPIDDARRRVAEGVVAQAMTDLVTRGAIKTVLDLVRRYGSLPLGGDGFVVRYVRGRFAYDAAREAHVASGADPNEAADDNRVRAMYIDAGDLLMQAYGASDATRFAVERAASGQYLGLCLYYRGAFVRAADRFVEVASVAAGEQRETALWWGLKSFDEAAEKAQLAGDTELLADLSRRRDELATLYLEEMPRGDRPARLLLSRSGIGGLDDERAAEILLGLPVSSPLYAVARRRGEFRLYSAWQRTPSTDQPAAAARYLSVAVDVIDEERRDAISAAPDRAGDIFERLLARASRALTVALTEGVEDVASARRVLRVVEELADRVGVEVSDARAALFDYRRLQIASYEGDVERVEVLLLGLEAQDDRAAELAVRFLWGRASSAAEAEPDDPDRQRDLVRRGRAVLDAAAAGGRTTEIEASAVRHRVARAAAAVWSLSGDASMRTLAIALDAESMAAEWATDESLRRLGRLGEEAGRSELALEAWRTLSVAAEPGSRVWYEARYNAIRLIAVSDESGAVAALRQHLALYPGGGPSPWDDRFAALARQLGVTP